jgi:hypothetical protein
MTNTLNAFGPDHRNLAFAMLFNTVVHANPTHQSTLYVPHIVESQGSNNVLDLRTELDLVQGLGATTV